MQLREVKQLELDVLQDDVLSLVEGLLFEEDIIRPLLCSIELIV